MSLLVKKREQKKKLRVEGLGQVGRCTLTDEAWMEDAVWLDGKEQL
jgi:hypothetical protein